MHLRPVLNTLRAALAGQSDLGGDPALDDAVDQLTAALGPALHVAALELAQQAAAEIDAQLTDRAVEVLLVDGEPTLRVTEAPGEQTGPAEEEFDARITLRLPPSLKGLIEQSATADGGSVNSWVVDALSRRANQGGAPGGQVTESFDL